MTVLTATKQCAVMEIQMLLLMLTASSLSAYACCDDAKLNTSRDRLGTVGSDFLKKVNEYALPKENVQEFIVDMF